VGVESVVEVGVVADPPAFDVYVAARWARLVRSAVLLGADHHAAEDLVQTALARCFLKWDRVTRAQDPDAYVHRALINTVNGSRRRRWHGERPTEVLPERVVPPATDQVGQQQALLDALGRLPTGQRETLVLRYYADFTEAQTAAVLGVAIGTVKSRCARALATLAADPTLQEDR
jgi:RNA polymerase sigma-70 factor (sigma-E family)